jgi:lipoate-protein ligase A
VTEIKRLDLSFASPAQNLACDEALLEELEAGFGEPTLRFWEASVPFVVVGYSNRIDTEVNRAECERREIPILRRSSGGGAVVQNFGCLNYNLTLPIAAETASIAETNCFIMRRQCEAVSELMGREAKIQGCTDLTLGGLKFSGNAQRRKSRALVFHGCFLLHANLELISALLAHPSKEPAYRGHRPHGEFLMNLNISAASVKAGISKAWSATEVVKGPSHIRIEALVATRYANAEWNEKF